MDDKKPDLLILDDEVEILNAVKRLLRKEYQVHAFTEAADALVFLANHTIPVIISDMRMPKMDGAEFLEKSVEISPNSVRILMTGFADMESAVKAINQGKIFSYVHKPWDNQQLKFLLKNAYQHNDILIQKEQLTKDLLESNAKIKALNGSLEEKVKIRTEQLRTEKAKLEIAHNQTKKFYRSMVSLLSGISSKTLQQHTGHSTRIANHAQAIAIAEKLPRSEVVSIYLAGVFHELGKLNMDTELSKTPLYRLNHDDQVAYLKFCEDSANMLSAFAPLKGCAAIIKQIQIQPPEPTQNDKDAQKNPESSESKSEDEPHPIAFGARLLKVIIDYDSLILGQLFPEKLPPKQARSWMLEDELGLYDKKIVRTYFEWLDQVPQALTPDLDFLVTPEETLSFFEAAGEENIGLIRNVEDEKGRVYLTKETPLTPSQIAHLIQIENNTDKHLILNIALQQTDDDSATASAENKGETASPDITNQVDADPSVGQ